MLATKEPVQLYNFASGLLFRSVTPFLPSTPGFHPFVGPYDTSSTHTTSQIFSYLAGKLVKGGIEI